MSEAGRLGQAVFCCCFESGLDRIGEGAFVADRDEEGFYVITGSQDDGYGMGAVF